MDFAEGAEHRDLRAAVASIASGFGPQYYARHAAERTPCDELWTKLGEAGFIGVNIPAEYACVALRRLKGEAAQGPAG